MSSIQTIDACVDQINYVRDGSDDEEITMRRECRTRLDDGNMKKISTSELESKRPVIAMCTEQY